MRALARSSALGLSLIALIFGGCGPKPSSVPLGLGPLALAERSDSTLSAVASAPVSPPPAAPAPAEVEPKETESSAEASSEEAGDAPEPAASKSDKPASFPGLYAGSDVATFRLPGLPEREQLDDKAKIRIEKASGDNVRIVLVNSEDGSDLCTLLARVDGNAALIEKPQPCFGSDGEGAMQAQLRSGRATLDGDALTMDAEGSLNVTLGDQDLEGELSYSFQGTRQ